MDYGYGSGDAAAAAAAFWSVFATVIVVDLIVFAVVYVLTGIGLTKLFRKVGVEPWAAWVPFFNLWRLLEVGGQPGWLAVLAIVPYANVVTVVFECIAAYKIGSAMRKGGEWVVLFYFLMFVWAWILGDNPSPYEPEIMVARGWKPPLVGYGSVRGPYVPPTGPPAG